MNVRVFSYEWIEVNAKTKKHIAECEDKCLCYACKQPFVPGERVIRKTHERCRSAQVRLVRQGIETDKSLVARGEVAEKSNGGRKPSNPVTVRARLGTT
jgi:hypothetical protein